MRRDRGILRFFESPGLASVVPPVGVLESLRFLSGPRTSSANFLHVLARTLRHWSSVFAATRRAVRLHACRSYRQSAARPTIREPGRKQFRPELTPSMEARTISVLRFDSSFGG